MSSLYAILFNDSSHCDRETSCYFTFCEVHFDSSTVLLVNVFTPVLIIYFCFETYLKLAIFK